MSIQSLYEPPQSPLHNTSGDIARKGRYVVYSADVEWPSRCFKCNQETERSNQVKLSYVNPWIYLSILITPIITIVLALIFRKKFTLNLPICGLHLRRRKNFLIFQWAMVALATAGFVIASIANLDILFAISILLVLVIVISAMFGRLVFAAKYKNENLWVSGAGKTFLNSLPDFRPQPHQ